MLKLIFYKIEKRPTYINKYNYILVNVLFPVRLST